MKIQSKFPHLFTKGLLFLFVTALFISCDDALEGKINPHIDMQEEIIINPEGGRKLSIYGLLTRGLPRLPILGFS